MPIHCTINEKPRRFHAFAAAPHLNRLLGGPLHALALQHVQRRLPEGMVREVDAPANPAYGWLDAGGISVNTARTVRTDTPLHELTHLWLLMLRHGKTGEPGRRYDQLSRQLVQDPAYHELAQHYPLSDNYRLSDQIEEVSAYLVGQLAARRLALGRVPVLGRLLALAEQLVGRYVGLGGAVLSKPLHEIVSALASDILRETPLDVDANWVREHLAYARYQGADQPATARELLGRISGVGSGVSESRVLAKAAASIKQLRAGATSVKLPNPLSAEGYVEPPLDHLTLAERIDYVTEHWRQFEASKTALAGDGALALLRLPVEQLAKVLAGDWDSLPDDPQYSGESLRALAEQLGNVFTDVQPGDSIVRYGAGTMPEGTYDPAFDDGLTMVHLRPRRRSDGSPVTEAVIVRLQSGAYSSREADLTAKRGDKPLLAGLYSGSWGGAALGWANKKFFGLKLTGSSFNRAMLGSTALALHLSDRGLHVTGVGVGKIDMDSTPSVQRNDVRRYPITEFLQAWQSLGQIADVQQLMPARLQELLKNPKLLDTLTYEQDYVRNLGSYVVGKNKLRAVADALGEYEASGRQNSARGLIQSIEQRLRDLKKFYGDNKQGYYRSPEVVALGQAHLQLQGIMMLANPHADLGAFDQYVRSFNAGDNPVLQWFHEAWRSAREKSVNAFLSYQLDRTDVTENLKAAYHRRNGMLNPLFHDESKYYERLFQTSAQTYTDKNGQVRSMELNEYRFKMPGTPAFTALEAEERAYINWALAAMKDSYVSRYLATNTKARNPAKLAKEALENYEKTWGQGYLPLLAGGVGRSTVASVQAGGYGGQALARFEDYLDENYSYDEQANSNQDTLSDRFAMQAGQGEHGSESRLSQLGLMATTEADAQGVPQTRYVLDPEQGRLRNLSLDGNLMRVIDQYVMSNLKHENATDLQTKKHTAVALLRSGFRESGILRGTQERNDDGTPAENTSRAERALNSMYDLLVLGKRNQVKQSEAVRRMGQWLAASGNTAALAALGFSAKTAAASLVSNVFNAVDVGIANWGQDHGLTLPTMTKALGQLAKPGKLWAVCKLMRTLDMDEHSLLESWQMNGEGIKGLKISDAAQESFIFDRMGDMACRMWLTASQMMQDGSWDAYDWNEKTGTLTYNETKHREIKGDAFVDAIKKRMLETGELGLDEQGNPLPMERGNDDRMRGSVEAWNADVLGGYKEEAGTTMGTNIFLRMISKFRTYLLRTLESWTKDERQNTNAGYYDNDTQQWVSRQEVGLFTSFAKLLGGVGVNRGNALKTWEQLSQADRYNLKRASAGSLVTIAALLATAAIFDDDEEKEEKKYGIAYHALHSLVRDQFFFYQLRTAGEAALSPMVALSFIDRMGAALGDYLTGDLAAGNRIVTRNVGVFKTADWLNHVFFNEEEKKKK